MTTTNHTSPSGEELKPCPFCGNEDIQKGRAAIGARATFHTYCSSCAAGTQGHPTRETSDAAWNRRAVASAQPIGEDAANGAIGQREASVEPLAWYVEWEVGAETWVDVFANESTAIDKGRLHNGKVIPCYPSAPDVVAINQGAALDAADALEKEYLRVANGQIKPAKMSLDPLVRAVQAIRELRAALTAEKVAGQEPVAWRYLTPTGWHATAKIDKALGASAHHDMEPLYAAPQQPAQSAEQEERAAYSVEDWFRDLAGSRPIGHVLQEMTHAELAVRAFSAGRAASTATQSAQAERGLTKLRSLLENEIAHSEFNDLRLAPDFGRVQGDLAVRAASIQAFLDNPETAAQPASGGEA
jgi:Lar family restriction alleviation protein